MQQETAIRQAWRHEFLVRIGPCLSVEDAERHATPLEIGRPGLIAINLNVHDQRTGLLDLPDTPKLHGVAESGGNFAASGKSAEIAARNSWQNEKDGGRSQQDGQSQGWPRLGDGKRHS